MFCSPVMEQKDAQLQHREESVIKQKNLQDMGEADGVREGMKGQKVSQGCLEVSQ